jgi:hypothetical protein
VDDVIILPLLDQNSSSTFSGLRNAIQRQAEALKGDR